MKIQTCTGRFVDPFRLVPADIDIEEGAAVLSRICRFNGHTRKFYSVAEHSCHAFDVASEENKLWALVHDLAEYIQTDIPSPIKYEVPELVRMCKEGEQAVAMKFGLPWPMPAEIKEIDLKLLATEATQLLPEPAAGWRNSPEWFPKGQWPGVYDLDVKCWHPVEAESQFMRRFLQVGKLSKGRAGADREPWLCP
jgi:hypothetical protein